MIILPFDKASVRDLQILDQNCVLLFNYRRRCIQIVPCSLVNSHHPPTPPHRLWG